MANKSDYLAYLSSAGYSEDEVLAMVDHAQGTAEDRTALAGILAILSKMSDEHQEYVQNVFDSLKSNTNHLLQNTIDGRLKKRFSEAGIYYFDSVFAGVFPTNDFNARAISKYPGLVLLDTACFELIEAFISISMWEASYEERAIHIGNIAQKLHSERVIPAKKTLDHESLRKTGVNAWIISIVTAAEEFVLAHEYGHLTLGHLESNIRNESNSVLIREFEADKWATDALFRRNSLWGDSEESIKQGYEAQIAGTFATLGIAHFMEYLYGSSENSSYPSARLRLENIINLTNQKGLGSLCDWGLPLLDLSSAVRIYLAFGSNGLNKPKDMRDILKIKPHMLMFR